MKVFFVSEYYPPYVKAGSEVSTSLLAAWLVQQGNTVSVACSEVADHSWTEKGATIYPVIIQPPTQSKSFFRALWSGFSVIGNQFISMVRVVKLIGEFKPDIVNAVPSPRLMPIVIGIKLFTNYPIVIDCRAYDLVCPSHLSPAYLDKKKNFNEEIQTSHGYRCVGYTSVNDVSFFSIRPFAVYESFMFNLYKYTLRFLANNFNGIVLVGVSKFVQKQLILNGFRAEKTTNIYNISQYIDSKKNISSTASEIPMFSYGGRIENDKGVWDIVAAVEILKRQLHQPFAVKIAGSGGELDQLKKYVEKNNLNNYITVLGKIKPEEVLVLYEQSIAILGPSRWPEPFGRFILDSISVGKPLIAARSGGTPEGVEDGVTGFLVDVENPEQLAKAMRYFIENPARSEAMKAAITQRQKYYEADCIGKQRLVLYENLLGNSAQ